jgi:hypothetical protein
VALYAIQQNRKQTKENWDHSQQQVKEERHHQSQPIVVPVGEFTPSAIVSGPGLYMSNGIVNWNYQGKIRLELQNMGRGVALNVHCILYGSDSMYTAQFVAWNNGPIGKNPIQVIYEHSPQLLLSPGDSIDEVHPLYDTSPPSSSNPAEDHIACLTITYQDLFEIKHMSIFNYTLDHRWECVTIGKIPAINEKPPLDLKELNDQKRQQARKLSAPAIKTL